MSGESNDKLRMSGESNDKARMSGESKRVVLRVDQAHASGGPLDRSEHSGRMMAG